MDNKRIFQKNFLQSTPPGSLSMGRDQLAFSSNAGHHFPLLVAKLDAHFHILAKGLALLLGKGCHDGEQNLSFRIQGVDVFFLEKHRNTMFF